MYTAHGRPVYAVLCSLLFLQLFLQQTLAQGDNPCTTIPICSPATGDIWSQDSLESIIWNPTMMAPFGQYDMVDAYIADDGNDTRVFLLQSDVDLSLGVTATRLAASLFPEDLPPSRSCHIVLIKTGNALDGTHQTLNSSSFSMLRTMETINGTLVPIPATSSSTATLTATPSASTTTITKTTTTTTTTHTSTTNANTTNTVGTYPTTLPAPSETSISVSPLVIGVISAGCVALIIALIALTLLVRTRRRFKGSTGDFKSLHDQPNSPTDITSKTSIFKSEGAHDMVSSGSFAGAALGGAMATGRSSSNTARSAEPTVKGALGVLGYNSLSPSSPTSSLPLVERKPSTLHLVPESTTEAAVAGATGSTTAPDPDTTTTTTEAQSLSLNGPALSAGDAQLIAETFRKSMRRPRWDTDTEEEEQDEARRAANELLRKELSEQGLDVQRGVQRRVTIQDRTHRSSLQPPLSQTVPLQENEDPYSAL